MVFEITVFNLQVGFNAMTLSVYRNGAIDSFIERKQFYALQRTTRTRVFLLTGLLFYSNWLTSLQDNFFERNRVYLLSKKNQNNFIIKINKERNNEIE